MPRAPFPLLFALAALLGCNGCGSSTKAPQPPEVFAPDVAPPEPPSSSDEPLRMRVAVHARHPHDPEAFTQGLVFSKGKLFESTGIAGRSSLREVELATGKVLRRRDNTRDVFAEGLALVGEELVQLSWQNGRAFRYRRDDFEPIGEHRYDTEGWGLCFDGNDLVMSDGSARLVFRDPKTFEVRRVASVFRGDHPQANLNELECVGEYVYANVWTTNDIVRIRARDGKIDAVIDASGLLSDEEAARVDVLNGIAHLPESGRFLITGKLWPAMFEVSFVPAD
jgi:glutaminyl-peptide cyclotransferase